MKRNRNCGLTTVQLITTLYTMESDVDREKTQNEFNCFVLVMLDGKSSLLFICR